LAFFALKILYLDVIYNFKYQKALHHMFAYVIMYILIGLFESVLVQKAEIRLVNIEEYIEANY